MFKLTLQRHVFFYKPISFLFSTLIAFKVFLFWDLQYTAHPLSDCLPFSSFVFWWQIEHDKNYWALVCHGHHLWSNPSSSSTGVMQILYWHVCCCSAFCWSWPSLEYNIIMHLLQHNSYFHGMRSTSLPDFGGNTYKLQCIFDSLNRLRFSLNGVIFFKDFKTSLFMCLVTRKKVYSIFCCCWFCDSHTKIWVYVIMISDGTLSELKTANFNTIKISTINVKHGIMVANH